MINVNGIDNLDYDTITVDEDWNECDEAELIMHTIHAYPAKFPAFMASKAFEYAQNEGVNIVRVADIFCGCCSQKEVFCAKIKNMINEEDL